MVWVALVAFLAPMLQEGARDEIRKRLEETKVSIDVEGTLEETLTALGGKLGISIYLYPREAERADPGRKIPLHLTDVRGSTALYWAAKLRGLDWVVQDGLVVLGKSETLTQDRQERIYDVTGVVLSPAALGPPLRLDLDAHSGSFRLGHSSPVDGKEHASGDLRSLLAELIAPKSPDAVRRALEQIGEEGTESEVGRALADLVLHSAPEGTRDSVFKAIPFLGAGRKPPDEATPDPLVDLLKEAIAPGTWEGRKVLEQFTDGKLVASQTPRVLDDVEKLLSALRQMAPPPIRVTATLLEANEAVGARAVQARSASLDPEETRALLREAKVIDQLGITCLECQESETQSIGTDAIYVLRARASLDSSGQLIRVRLGLQEGATSYRMAGGINLADRGLARFSTTVVVPNGGSTLFFLPGRRAMLLAAQAEVPNAPGEVDLDRSEEADPAQLAQKLAAAAPVDVNFKNAPLAQVIDYFRQSTHLNFVVDLDAQEGEVFSFQAKQIRPAAALAMMLRPHNKAFIPDREAFRVDSSDHMNRIRLWVANLRSLDDDHLAFNDIANLIKNSVEKDRWEEADGKLAQATGNGLLLVRNDSEMIQRVRRFLSDLARRQTVVTLEAEEVRVDALKGREALGGFPSGSLLKEADARRLSSLEGAELERLTLRGQSGKTLAMHWEGSRQYSGAHPPVPEAAIATSRLQAEVRAVPQGVRVSLQLEDHHFSSPKEAERPRSAESRLQTTLVIPSDQVAVFELPDVEGKALYLLLRANSTR